MSYVKTWNERLQELLARFPQYGIGGDAALVDVAEMWGLFGFLSRLEEGHAHG